ncbi:MAG: GGDEF domain-containing protein [Lachnospiraceae bacterium]|nr:GGDEF domain-containing protein [Lachnospiraceae bacterium]
MNYRKEKYAIPYLVLFCLLTAGLIFYLFLFTDFNGFVIGQDEDRIVDLTASWQTDDGRALDLFETSAADFNGEMHLSCTLPDELPDNPALCLISRNAAFTFTLGGKELYHYETIENLTGKGYGTAFHTVVLCPDYAGKKVDLDVTSVFDNHSSGRIGNIFLCSPEAFTHIVVRNRYLPVIFSLLVISFGLLMLIIYFFIPRQQTALTYNLAALGASLMILGMWCFVDTGLIQYVKGCVIACRVMDYTLIHLAAYPLVRFVNSMTLKKRPLYPQLAFWIPAACFSVMLYLRYFLNIDMTLLTPIIYTSYLSMLVLIIVILVDNEIVCRKLNTPTHLIFFYIGIGAFIVTAVLDTFVFETQNRSHMLSGHGNFFRIGLLLLLLAIIIQVLRWWTRDQNAIERDRVINKVLQYAASAQDADVRINEVLEYVCTQLHADRAYIFEDQLDGTFSNTYEWCKMGVHPQIANRQDIPYDNVIEVWYSEFKKNHHILIDDADKYRKVSERISEILISQDVHALVTGPLEIEGKYVGFFGVDNPPVAYINEASEILRLLSFVFAQMVSQRDEQNILLQNSYHDEMTGVKNRRALDEFEGGERDVSKPFGYIMCDINGLKHTNDTLGHDAGDSMIIDIATSLAVVFGYQNVYRMGGDEFIIYDFADNESVFNDEVAQVRKYIDKKGRSVSIGCVYCKAGTTDIKPIKEMAEQQMYKEKRAYYEGHFDRRGTGRRP